MEKTEKALLDAKVKIHRYLVAIARPEMKEGLSIALDVIDEVLKKVREEQA